MVRQTFLYVSTEPSIGLRWTRRGGGGTARVRMRSGHRRASGRGSLACVSGVAASAWRLFVVLCCTMRNSEEVRSGG